MASLLSGEHFKIFHIFGECMLNICISVLSSLFGTDFVVGHLSN